ncbi:hypothetical protein C1T29_05275, partial [Bacillus sp. MBGLi79]
IQAGALAKGRQIFVLDMGEPVKIVDLKNRIKKEAKMNISFCLRISQPPNKCLPDHALPLFRQTRQRF